MSFQRLVGRRHVLHDPANQLIGGHAFRKRLIRQHEPVAKYIGNDIRSVFGQHVRAAAQKR
jgi:hypothetical protein